MGIARELSFNGGYIKYSTIKLWPCQYSDLELIYHNVKEREERLPKPRRLLVDKLYGHRHIEGDCWLWTGRCDKQGYGLISYKGGHYLVHRLFFCLVHNFDPKDTEDCVLHVRQCFNRNCFNPRHLYFGDARQNAEDRVAVGHDYNKNKTHCIRGHEFSTGNTILVGNGRLCKTCCILRDLKRRKESKWPLGLSAIELQVLGYE
jgi:hypothetical protein